MMRKLPSVLLSPDFCIFHYSKFFLIHRPRVYEKSNSVKTAVLNNSPCFVFYEAGGNLIIIAFLG